MILLESDWDKYPTAIANDKTTNKSFVRLALLLKKMGIKNYAFPLALINQNLVLIDPFAPDLTAQEQLAIAYEARLNPWFYLREIARAPGKAGDDAVPFEANRANIALWFSFFQHVLFLLVQPRQTGKSFATDTLMVYLMYVMCRNSTFSLLTAGDKLRQETIKRMKEIIDELPPYMQLKTPEDKNNTEEISVVALGNHYNAHVPATSEKLANLKGRGLSTPVVHVDEGPFQPLIDITVPAMLAGMGAVRERAQRADAPYGVIFTTTAGSKDDRSGSWFFNNIVLDSAQWTERFYDAASTAELHQMVRKNSPGDKLQINGTFSHTMLGKTDQWLKERIEESMAKGASAEKDFLNIWTSGGQGGPLSAKIKETIANSRMEPLYQEISEDGYIFRWYIEEAELSQRMLSHKFVLGVDTSEAAGRDGIAMVMLDVETGAVIGSGFYNETNLITFSIWLAKFLIKYENTTAIIERRSTGGMIIDQLMLLLPRYGQDPFRRVFNRIVNDQNESAENAERYREIRTPLGRRDQHFHAERKSSMGFATSSSGLTSRTGLYSITLQEAAKKGGDKVHDQLLVAQILGLITKNGRVDHGADGHDDLVIAWMLGYWLLTQGQNLSYYGIDPSSVLAEARVQKVETAEERAQRYEQIEIREQIETLAERLAGEPDEFVSRRLEQQLRVLDRRLVLQEDEYYSLDELLQSIRASRGRRSGAPMGHALRGMDDTRRGDLYHDLHDNFGERAYYGG